MLKKFWWRRYKTSDKILGVYELYAVTRSEALAVY
jgi:hypothetical protein